MSEKGRCDSGGCGCRSDDDGALAQEVYERSREVLYHPIDELALRFTPILTVEPSGELEPFYSTGTPVDAIPPMKIGDLGCGVPSTQEKAQCAQYCMDRDLCASICTYRKNLDGECVLYVRCTDCQETPEFQALGG